MEQYFYRVRYQSVVGHTAHELYHNVIYFNEKFPFPTFPRMPFYKCQLNLNVLCSIKSRHTDISQCYHASVDYTGQINKNYTILQYVTQMHGIQVYQGNR